MKPVHRLQMRRILHNKSAPPTNYHSPSYFRVCAVVLEYSEGQTCRHTDGRDQYTFRLTRNVMMPTSRSCIAPSPLIAYVRRAMRLFIVNDRSFPIATARSWNSLPQHVTLPSSLYMSLQSTYEDLLLLTPPGHNH